MNYDTNQPIEDYYALLGVERNASRAQIEQALVEYINVQQERLMLTLTMKAARIALDKVPPMNYWLLSDDPTRRPLFDQLLAELERKAANRSNLHDDEGLDDEIEHPFFFDPDNGYDTETPVYTIREVAEKLDSEWKTTHGWIRRASNDTHVLVGYLTYAAGRISLAERIDQVITAASEKKETSPLMDKNEAIERCINILDPQVERPSIEIANTHFDGKILDAGSFISDVPAATSLILRHDGDRGCVFGTVELYTNWLTLRNGTSKAHFALMPIGTSPEIGPSEITIPLSIGLGSLQRDADYHAELVIHLENQKQMRDIPIRLQLHVLPLPPRVIFQPNSTPSTPVPLGIVRQGERVTRLLRPINQGDEHRVPLQGRILSRDPNTFIQPSSFSNQDTLTVTVDTTNRPPGEPYDIVLQVNYITANSKGPTNIYLRGELLPTFRQSFFRESSLGNRIGAGVIFAILSLSLFDLFTVGLESHTTFTWLLLFLIPAGFIFMMQQCLKTIVFHKQRTGDMSIDLKNVAPPWLRWWLPVGVGLLFALLCAMLPQTAGMFWLSSIIGLLLGGGVGSFVTIVRAQPEVQPNLGA